jgi:hypothetical protein
MFYLALRRAGVPAEMHLYREGAHGIGLQPGHGPISDWPARCAEWMVASHLLRGRDDLRTEPPDDDEIVIRAGQAPAQPSHSANETHRPTNSLSSAQPYSK